MTRNDAINATYRQELYHRWLKNADGTPMRCRVNGKCKTWKTRPDDFSLPVKRGLRECFYINPANQLEWSEVDEQDRWVHKPE